MRRLSDLAVRDLLERVQAVAVGVEGVHQMHGGRREFVFVGFLLRGWWTSRLRDAELGVAKKFRLRGFWITCAYR